MDKHTFMKELEKSLSVLQESEVQDILNEYEQHIDMKVKNGLSEEEAIQDFGSLAELTGEILEVYHVRSDYGNQKEETLADGENQNTKNWNFQKTAEKLKDAAETAGTTTGSFLSRMAKMTKKLLGKAGERFSGFFSFWKEKFCRLSSQISSAWNKRKADREVSPAKPQGGSAHALFLRLWLLTKKGFRTAKFLTFWLLKGLWNGFWMFTSVCFGGVGIFFLFCLGVLVVLMLQDYPVAGITLGCFGMSVSIFSCAGLAMTFFRKRQRILLGALLGGVLLGGVGAGIALVEYSSFSYGGEKLIGYENLATDYFDFQFEPEKGVLVADTGYWGNRTQAKLISDEAVPENVVRFEVTYNKKQIEPFLNFTPIQEGESGFQEAKKKQGTVEFLASSQGSDLEVFMECKDEFLKEFKEKKISSYDMAYITKITILVNPETIKYVEISR